MDADDLINKTVGQFQIECELGRGGMAVVYKAYQAALQRTVAIKVLPRHFAHDPAFIQRFRQEAIAAAKLRHPHIITIHDVGQSDDLNYIVMELIEGASLASLVRQGPMPPSRVSKLVEQVAQALDYAHQQGFIHRDIKPGNIMASANDHATLMDFGIAKALSGARLTQTGVAIGTPEYMSPEQVTGGDIDGRTDVYSLGIVAYEMLTGQVPFSGTTATVLYKQANEPPSPLRSHIPSLSASVENVILRALSKRREERYTTAGQFAQALTAAAAGKPISTQPASGARPGRRAPWLLWALGGGAIIALTLIAVLVGVMIGGAGRSTPGPSAQAATAAAAPTHTFTPETATHVLPDPTQATPTSTLLIFQAVPLGNFANGSLSDDYASPPTGQQMLGGVPFDLDGRAFKSQAQPSPNDVFPTKGALAAGIARVEQVHVLLTAGDAFIRWQGQTVGRITLVFDAAPQLDVPLVLGLNLREWHASDNVVSSAPGARQVWQGPIVGRPDLNGTLDMLTIEVPADRRQATLVRIEFYDTSESSESSVGSLDPAFTISGVSVAHR